MTDLPTRVLTADVFDRVRRLRTAAQHMAEIEAINADHLDGYEHAMDDLLDLFYGFCNPKVALQEAG